MDKREQQLDGLLWKIGHWSNDLLGNMSASIQPYTCSSGGWPMNITMYEFLQMNNFYDHINIDINILSEIICL